MSIELYPLRRLAQPGARLVFCATSPLLSRELGSADAAPRLGGERSAQSESGSLVEERAIDDTATKPHNALLPDAYTSGRGPSVLERLFWPMTERVGFPTRYAPRLKRRIADVSLSCAAACINSFFLFSMAVGHSLQRYALASAFRSLRGIIRGLLCPELMAKGSDG